MALTTPPNAPVPASEAVFNASFEGFASWAQTIPSQINTLSFSTINATSTTSIAVGTGSKSIVLALDTAFVVGHRIMCWNSPSNWMLGYITSYTSGTKTLVFTVLDKEGSATLASWTISVHGLSDAVDITKNIVEVSGGTGMGTVNTLIRRFATVVQNNGTAITYADSSTLGGSFTINEDGWYMMDLQDTMPSTSTAMGGISVNTTQPTVAINGLTNKDEIVAYSLVANTTTNAVTGGSVQAIRYFYSGDVVRAHYSLSAGAGTLLKFTIAKML